MLRFTIRNRLRARKARKQGHDTFISTKGEVCFARKMAPNEEFKLPLEQLKHVKGIDQQ